MGIVRDDVGVQALEEFHRTARLALHSAAIFGKTRRFPAMNPNLTSRRAFITQSALAFTALSASRVLGANEKIRIASIGLGGQGTGNAGRMAKVPGVEVVML